MRANSRALVRPSLERSYLIRSAPMIALRSILFSIVILSLDAAFELGTSPYMLSLAACTGTIFGSLAAFTNLTTRGFLTLATLGYILSSLVFKILNFLPGLLSSRYFSVYALTVHASSNLSILLICAISTWGFWRSRHILTIEIISMVGLVVYLFSGHRDFHFDSPQVVNDLAWWFRIEPIALLIGLGLCVFLVLLGYLYLATHPSKPEAAPFAPTPFSYAGRTSWFSLALLTSLLGSLLYLISSTLYGHYNLEAQSRIANGVGEASSEGLSPLGFHSALGSTNQPSALVRLDGDYKENPFSPMLYLRESALSAFNGRELTIAKHTFDRDIPNTTPGEPFQGEEDVELGNRVPLSQTMYLLTDHKLGFAADYPVTISPVKNPNPSRFKSAFKAYSIAPAFSLSELSKAKVGDPRWSEQAKQLYLTTHPDMRYSELAHKLAGPRTSPVEQALSVVDYFNKTAIYTLTPNHEVGPNDDPVAPFAFGDHRGYCVHFAHALVYIFRSLGIPSRIATGYLTDLSQAKDGHILLRMSDRHAWAEIFVQGYGWIPFDLQPEQVESHADSQVDMKVLEDLMTLLEPGDEVLPKDILRNERSEEAKPWDLIGNSKYIFLVLACLIAILVISKLYLRYSWILPSSPQSKVQRFYTSILSALHDLGYVRNQGETRVEYRERLQREYGLDTLSLTKLQQKLAYSLTATQNISAQTLQEVRDTFNRDMSSILKLPISARIKLWISPTAAIQFISRYKW